MKRAHIAYSLVLVIVVVIFGWWCFWPCWFGDSTTVLLVRHAEKSASPPSDPVLAPAGEVRAATLPHVAADAGVSAIYVTNTNRTRQTAQDLADLLGLTPEVPSGSVAELVNDIRTDHRGETIVVVGHSNTVPDIIEAMIGVSLPDIDDNEYDKFIVVVLPCCGRGTVVDLQYGEPSP